MKRKAILLGHVDGELSTSKDMADVYRFLVSLRGGAWEQGEVYLKKNIRLHEICVLLDDVRNQNFDYVFFYFSGHGGYVRDTEIELNPDGERISERYLSGLATRQLNIYDCCRAPIPVNFALNNSMEMLKESSASMRGYARQKYNARVMAAMPQQMSLYACSRREYAHDYGKGGIYTQNLLSVVQASGEVVLLASKAHAAACVLTSAEASLRHNEQHPDYFMAKLPSRYQIPIAISETSILEAQ